MSVYIDKIPPYRRIGVIINYHYISDPKLFQGIVAVWIIPFIFHMCQKQLIIPWENIYIYPYNHLRYSRVVDFKHYPVFVTQNILIIANFIDYVTKNVGYVCTH